MPHTGLINKNNKKMLYHKPKKTELHFLINFEFLIPTTSLKYKKKNVTSSI